jgi:DNA repair protein RadC
MSNSPEHAETVSEGLVYAAATPPVQVRDIPLRLRPREEFERRGAAQVSDAVLLALILRSGTRGCNVVDLANRLLIRFGSLTALSRAEVDEIRKEHGMGKVKAQVLKAALELGRRIAEERIGDAPCLNTPAAVADLLREEVRGLDREHFWVLPLNTRNRLSAPPEVSSRGTLDASLVHPREVFKKAIKTDCAAVIVAHNHPSGDPSPSATDLQITRKLVEAGKVLGVKLLDHVVLGRARCGFENDYISLRESGLVEFK